MSARMVSPAPAPLRGQPFSSHPHGLAHGGADVGVYDKVGDLILLGGIAIDNGQSGAVALGEERESSGGIDHERAAEHDEEVGGKGGGPGALHLRLMHRLAKRDGG